MIVFHSVRHRWLAKTETWLHNQVQYLPDGVEAHVVARVAENRKQFPVRNLHLTSEASAWHSGRDAILEGLRLRRYPGFLVDRAREVGCDLVHAHFGPWGWAVRDAAKRLGVPLVVTFYGFDVNQLPKAQPRFRARYRQLFGDAAAILCEGAHMRDCIVALGCPPEKAHVHRLGVELDRIDCRPRSIDPSGPVRVLLAAAFREKKGLSLAIEALGRLRGEVDLSVTLIGDASELAASQREKARIERAIAASGLEVKRLGFQPHSVLFEEAARHDLFMAPSVEGADGDTEGGAPVALIEMAAAGIPIVASDHCDIPGVILDGKTGLLAREGSVDHLEERLREALGTGVRWEEMTRAGRQHVEAEFDASAQGRRLAGHYMRVTGAPRQDRA